MLTYSDISTYLQQWLAGLSYNPLPFFDPGPGVNLDAIDANPDRIVLCSIGGGAGFATEMVFDRPMVSLRTIGKQMDYLDAETLAFDCDRGMVAIDHSQMVNGEWWSSINRVGGGPALLLKDDGDRYHFTCNYIVEVVF